MESSALIKKIIELAIEEDVATGDITTESIISANSRAVAIMTAKAPGVISGIDVIKEVFEHFDKDIFWTPYVKEAEKVAKGDTIIRVEGSYRALLTAERTALNILQRMSGIASTTSQFIKELEGTSTKILDTRKTAPGMRVLDKMAVKSGGGENHRIGLFDMVLIKDNHINVAGGITKAVAQIRSKIPAGMLIETETTNLDEVREALEAGSDIIMLDNMENKTMADAVIMVKGKAKTEASGNMSLERLRGVALTGVDYISVGALTHSVTALDISMNIVEEKL
jgi:nicotinate-nucleotide pyrophosphorylase (carboxylating)